MIVASATVAHKPHAELDSIYQGQEPKGKTVLEFANEYRYKKKLKYILVNNGQHHGRLQTRKLGQAPILSFLTLRQVLSSHPAQQMV